MTNTIGKKNYNIYEHAYISYNIDWNIWKTHSARTLLTKFSRTASSIQKRLRTVTKWIYRRTLFSEAKTNGERCAVAGSYTTTLIILAGISGGRTWSGLCTRPRPATWMTHVKYVGQHFCFKILCNHNCYLYTYITKKNREFDRYDLFTRFSIKREGEKEAI